jgi:16S rRNA processing protein RimM
MRRSDSGLPGTGVGGSRTAPPAAEKPRPALAAPVVSDKTRLCVARIGAPHGTNGEVKLWSFTAEPQAVTGYGALETADGARAFEIEALRPAGSAGDCFIARLKGVTDRSAVERLRNLDLYVPRARLPAPQPDEFYHADLIGLAVDDGRGRMIGSVVAVHNFGAGDLLEIALDEGSDTVMLPFTAAAVPQVEVAAGRIVLDPAAKLIEGAHQRRAQPRKPARK